MGAHGFLLASRATASVSVSARHAGPFCLYTSARFASSAGSADVVFLPADPSSAAVHNAPFRPFAAQSVAYFGACHQLFASHSLRLATSASLAGFACAFPTLAVRLSSAFHLSPLSPFFWKSSTQSADFQNSPAGMAASASFFFQSSR